MTRDRATRARLLFFFFLGWLFAICQAQTPSQPALDRGARWRQDLHYFADEFSRRHLDFEKLYGRSFSDEMGRLQAGAAELSDVDIVLRLMRLVASANVDHTSVTLPLFTLGFHQIPISLQWYADGPAVVSATPKYATAIGARVVRIGTRTPEEVLAAIAPYISHENEAGLRQSSPAYLETVEILQRAGAANSDGSVTFTLAKVSGEALTLGVVPGDPRVAQVGIFDALDLPAALYRKHPRAYDPDEDLPDSHALYLQYNRCANDPALAFKDFVRDVFASADASRAERLVIDLRFNPGGDSRVINPLRAALGSRPALGSRVSVLIGPGTASSAQDAAIALRHALHATLIGEPTREAPNGYGEVRTMTLPNSQLSVQYSTKYFTMIRGNQSSALEPDVKVVRTFQDVLNGRDPVLDAALAATAPRRGR